jgi:hypothetical protein
MPLQLNDDEMSVLMTLAGPIDQRLRPQFLEEVAQELEAKRQPAKSERDQCIGWRVRFNGSIGIRPSCRTRARWRAPSWNTTGRPRLSLVERPGFFASSVGLLQRKLDGRGRDAVAAGVPATLCSSAMTRARSWPSNARKAETL